MEDNNTTPPAPTKTVATINSNYAIPIAIVVAGLAIASAIYFGNTSKGDEIVPQRGQNEKISVVPVADTDHLIGNPNAKIIIVEYSDLECPYCKVFHTTMNTMMNEYGAGGKVAWVYRHFPIAQLHSKAHKEAQATECANKIGGNTKFWEYTNKIFSITPSNNGLNESELFKTAQEIGLDQKAFNECLASGEMKGIVDRDISSGNTAGVRGTPHSFIFIDKKVAGTIDGAEPYEQVKAIIEQAIK